MFGSQNSHAQEKRENHALVAKKAGKICIHTAKGYEGEQNTI